NITWFGSYCLRNPASSPVSWEDATASAVKAARAVKEIRSVYVKEQSAVVVKNKIAGDRVNVRDQL
ncbi:MAG: dodecin family protein, partial [Bacteroidales bacterium]|nr:dodecin family protein [Bacteroidales bacterium]